MFVLRNATSSGMRPRGEFAPSRLAVARKRRGLTKVSLASKVDLSTRILTAYEKAEKLPTRQTVARLAEALEFPIEFFYAPEIGELPLGAASFRSLSSLTSCQRDQTVASGALALELSKWIEARFVLPKDDVPRLPNVDPETGATFVREEWGLGELPISNVIHLLEAHGVRVFSLVDECREVDAYSFWWNETAYVFLNTTKTAERVRMDACHELGHLVLHSGHRSPRGKAAEMEADRFGSAFLMPAGSVLSRLSPNRSLDRLAQDKRYWKVSLAALVYRMHTLGLLTDWQYRTHFVQISRNGWRTSEPPKTSIPHESSQLLAKVFATLRKDGITRADVARQLCIPLEELAKLVFGFTAIDGGNQGAVRQEQHGLSVIHGDGNEDTQSTA